MSLNINCILVCLTFISTVAYKTDDLLAVVHVFKHGESTPENFYPNDPYGDTSFWEPYADGKLTDIGAEQIYNLGKFTRNRYKDFLPSESSSSAVKGFTTDTEKTKSSCQAALAGIFSKENEKFDETILADFKFHLTDEEIFSPSSNCKIFTSELANVLVNGELFKYCEFEYAEVFKHISIYAGMTVKSIFGIYEIYQTLYVQNEFGFILPQWTETVYPEPMKTLAGQALKSLSYTDVAKRLAAGSWLHSVFNNFEEIFRTPSKVPRYQLYSGHDTNLATILNTIEAFEPHVPGFGDSVYFELRNKSGVPVVNVWHKTEFACVQISIACCELDCPLFKVQFLLKERLVDKTTWQGQCMSTATEHTIIAEIEKKNNIKIKRDEADSVLNRLRPKNKPFFWL